MGKKLSSREEMSYAQLEDVAERLLLLRRLSVHDLDDAIKIITLSNPLLPIEYAQVMDMVHDQLDKVMSRLKRPVLDL